MNLGEGALSVSVCSTLTFPTLNKAKPLLGREMVL